MDEEVIVYDLKAPLRGRPLSRKKFYDSHRKELKSFIEEISK